jgi:hypothetical protein
LELCRVYAALLELVATAARDIEWAAAPVQVGEAGYLYEAPRKVAVSSLGVDQAPPGICGSVPRLTLSARAGFAEAFLESVLMFALSDPCLSCRLSLPGIEIRRQRRQAKGKGDFQDASFEWLKS